MLRDQGSRSVRPGKGPVGHGSRHALSAVFTSFPLRMCRRSGLSCPTDPASLGISQCLPFVAPRAFCIDERKSPGSHRRSDHRRGRRSPAAARSSFLSLPDRSYSRPDNRRSWPRRWSLRSGSKAF